MLLELKYQPVSCYDAAQVRDAAALKREDWCRWPAKVRTPFRGRTARG